MVIPTAVVPAMSRCRATRSAKRAYTTTVSAEVTPYSTNIQGRYLMG